jgi:TM2 domain-containing membrane protein YozV
MANKETAPVHKKSPALAAIISAIFPGAGFFYIGNFLKGVAYIIIFALLIGLEVHASEYNSRAMEIVVLGILIAGFYIFQIVESFNDAGRTGQRAEAIVEGGKERISLFGSFFILILGVVFQMERLDFIELWDIIRLWPLLLVALGAKLIFDYSKHKVGKKDDQS